MDLTPDEIARRAFTPSADGYHQGEVRGFLERIATQVRTLQSTLPPGGLELSELTSAIQDREPRLDSLANQLDDVLGQLNAATAQMREAQAEAKSQLATTQQLATEHLLATSAVTSQLQAAQVASDQQRQTQNSSGVTSDQQRQTQNSSGVTSDQQRQTQDSSGVASAAAAAVNTPDKIDDITRTPWRDPEIPAERTVESPASTAVVEPLAATTTPEPLATQRQPATDVASPIADRGAEALDPLSLFGADLDVQPLFSDNANDLLDGVLDDVMGTITDEGNPL